MSLKISLLACLFSSLLYGADGGIEVWYFQKPQDLPPVPGTYHPGDTGGDFAVTHRTDTWKIDGLKLDAHALHIESIDAEIKADVRLQKRVKMNLLFTQVDQNVAQDFNGIGLRLHMKKPADIPMPKTLELQAVQKGGEGKLELTEAGRHALIDHFASQFAEFLDPKTFDDKFDHPFLNMSGPVEMGFKIWFNSKKGDMLGELKKHLVEEMAKPGYFENFLKDITRKFPVPISHNDQTIVLVMDRQDVILEDKTRIPLPTNTWIVREKDAPSRFAPATLLDIPRLPIQRPSATVAVHAVRLSHLVSEYFAHASENTDLSKLTMKVENGLLTYAPAATEREEIAKWIGSVDAPTDTNPSRVLGLEISGEHAPVVQPWYVPGQGGKPMQSFLDLWISARWIDPANPNAAQPRLGLLLVFSIAQDGKLHLAQLTPYKPGNRLGPNVPLSQGQGFGMHFGVKLQALLVQSLVNAKLDAFHPDNSLKGIAGVRMIGTRGQRGASNEYLAEAIAIDLNGQ